jgi:hypothetical protein
MGLATVFHCLRFETSYFVASYYSQGYGGGIRPHLHAEAVGRADRTENTVFLLIRVVLYHVLHCSVTVRLVSDRVATLLPTYLLLLRDVITVVPCSSVALISCLVCRNVVTALYMLEFCKKLGYQNAVKNKVTF